MFLITVLCLRLGQVVQIRCIPTAMVSMGHCNLQHNLNFPVFFRKKLLKFLFCLCGDLSNVLWFFDPQQQCGIRYMVHFA